MNLLSRIPARVGFALFCLAALYFSVRGPWRAVGSINSYDFASVYGAARCWLHGENPYDMQSVRREVHAAGDDPAVLPYTDPPPSVYLPTALPVVASIAWLPWKAARLVWTILSIATFVFSITVLFRHCTFTPDQKWLLGAGVLLFSPTSSGLSTGNPGVISCALTLAAIYLALEKRMLASALILGLAHSIKPQISIAAVAVLLLWGYRRTLALSFLVPAFAALASFLRAASFVQYRVWLTSLQSEIAAAVVPGGINDPSPANYFSYHLVNAAAILAVWLRDLRVVNILVWTAAAALTGVYLVLRNRVCGDRSFRDIAFFCALSLVLVYHRYYDTQLLLGVVPFLLTPAGKLGKTALVLWIGLLLLIFPLQAILAESLPQLNPASSAGFLLLRHQPIVVLLMSVLLIPWSSLGQQSGDGHGTLASAKVCNS